MVNKDLDYITINTKDGQKKVAEIITKFEISGFGEYIIYKLDNIVYGAKYKFDGENTILNTDLTDIEKNTLNEVFSNLEVE